MKISKLGFCTALLAVSISYPLAAQDAAALPMADTGDAAPSAKIGADDLLSVTIFNAPALSRKVRVSADGSIELPLLSGPVKAAGLMPNALAAQIEEAYQKQELLVKPSVSVSVMRYTSRPISVAGEVKNPTTFEASGKVTLLSALTRAGGVTPEAGPTLMVTEQVEGKPSTRYFVIKELMDGAHPELNIPLSGNEEIRVPRAPKVFVIGNVKRPGAYSVDDTSNLSVLKVVALAEGVLPFTSSEAYIARKDETGKVTEIAVDLRKMIKRKAPDVPMQANDLLYIGDAAGRRAAANALDKLAGFGSSTASGLLIWH